jgi:hypothetical protein
LEGERQVDRVETQRCSWSPIPPRARARARPTLPITLVLTLPLTSYDTLRRAQDPRSPLDPLFRVVRATIVSPGATWRAWRRTHTAKPSAR